MKKNLLQIFVCAIALIFIASVTHAYVSPISPQSKINTDAPLTIGTTDEVKSAGLAVGTFQARSNSYFDQNVLFKGLIRGGTSSGTATVPVTFGGPSNKVDVLFTGGVSINGVYQSDTLKTGGGKKPLCADANGTLYICGATPPTPPAPAPSIHLYAQYKTFDAGTFVVAILTHSVENDVTANISASAGSPLSRSGSLGTLLSFITHFYTAEAVTQGSCRLTSTPSPIGTLIVHAGTTDSSQVAGTESTLSLPQGCDPSTTILTVSSYSPHTTTSGKNITAN